MAEFFGSDADPIIAIFTIGNPAGLARPKKRSAIIHLSALGNLCPAAAMLESRFTYPFPLGGTEVYGLWRSLASAFDWGSKGRRFKSCQPDSEF